MTDLSLIRHFLAVAETRSFTRGAAVVNASQSVTSRAVQRLEDEIGTRLFDRSTRSVVLTPAGEAFQAETRGILDRLAVASAHARRIGRGEHAELRIGICETTEAPALLRGIADFRERWPDLAIRFQPLLSNVQIEALERSVIDVGILQGGIDFDAIETRLLARYGVLLAVPRSWGFDPSRRVRLIEFADRPWLMPDRAIAAAWHDGYVRLCRNAGFDPRIVGRADDPVTARMMISCGMGATFVHDKGMRDLGAGIELLSFEDSQAGAPASETIVAWPLGTTSPPIASLVECLAAACGAPGREQESAAVRSG